MSIQPSTSSCPGILGKLLFLRQFQYSRGRRCADAFTRACVQGGRISSIELTRNNISLALCTECSVGLSRSATSFIKLNNGARPPFVSWMGYQPSSRFPRKISFPCSRNVPSEATPQPSVSFFDQPSPANASRPGVRFPRENTPAGGNVLSRHSREG